MKGFNYKYLPHFIDILVLSLNNCLSLCVGLSGKTDPVLKSDNFVFVSVSGVLLLAGLFNLKEVYLFKVLLFASF